MAEEKMTDVIVTDAARPYLMVQRGQVTRGHPSAWDSSYNRSLRQDFEQMRPVLPDFAPISVLDVGSGMGGIDILLDRYYRTYAADYPSHFTMLDGTRDAPEVRRHAETYSNSGPAIEFLSTNGVADFRYVHPEWLNHLAHHPFDLVVSLKSWCFHYPPDVYLEQIMRLTHPNTVFILDVRNHRPFWQQQLASRLVLWKELDQTGPKHERLAFVRPDRDSTL